MSLQIAGFLWSRCLLPVSWAGGGFRLGLCFLRLSTFFSLALRGGGLGMGSFGRVLGPLLILGLALGIVALKALLLYAVARPFYCGSGDAALFAAALSQGGEFAFVLFGAAGGLLAPETASLLNAAVAVSMFTTPFLLMGTVEQVVDKIGLLREQLGETMFTEASKQLYGEVMAKVIKQAEADIERGRATFYED